MGWSNCCAKGGRLTLVDHPRMVTVRVSGREVARSSRVIRLEEGTLPPVFYFPPEDVRVELLRDSRARRRCPLKGEAEYRTLKVGEREIPDAAWTYPHPCPSVAGLEGYLAFFSNKVDSIEESALPRGD